MTYQEILEAARRTKEAMSFGFDVLDTPNAYGRGLLAGRPGEKVTLDEVTGAIRGRAADGVNAFEPGATRPAAMEFGESLRGLAVQAGNPADLLGAVTGQRGQAYVPDDPFAGDMTEPVGPQAAIREAVRGGRPIPSDDSLTSMLPSSLRSGPDTGNSLLDEMRANIEYARSRNQGGGGDAESLIGGVSNAYAPMQDAARRRVERLQGGGGDLLSQLTQGPAALPPSGPPSRSNIGDGEGGLHIVRPTDKSRMNAALLAENAATRDERAAKAGHLDPNSAAFNERRQGNLKLKSEQAGEEGLMAAILGNPQTAAAYMKAQSDRYATDAETATAGLERESTADLGKQALWRSMFGSGDPDLIAEAKRQQATEGQGQAKPGDKPQTTIYPPNMTTDEIIAEMKVVEDAPWVESPVEQQTREKKLTELRRRLEAATGVAGGASATTPDTTPAGLAYSLIGSYFGG